MQFRVRNVNTTVALFPTVAELWRFNGARINSTKSNQAGLGPEMSAAKALDHDDQSPTVFIPLIQVSRNLTTKMSRIPTVLKENLAPWLLRYDFH
jgi:hypothetical protein